MSEQAMLREPTRRETRFGWWFMRTFRAAEVERRTKRNAVISAAWRVHFYAHTAEDRAADLRLLSEALEAYADLP